MIKKLGMSEDRASKMAAEFMQELADEKLRADRNRTIVDRFMEDRALFETFGDNKVGADRVLLYVNSTLELKNIDSRIFEEENPPG